MEKLKFRIVMEVETENEQLDYSVVDDYIKRKVEEERILVVIGNISVMEL